MTYYLLKKYSKYYVVRNGYSTLNQLRRNADTNNPIVIKSDSCSFYPGDRYSFDEIKDLLINVNLKKLTTFEGDRIEYAHRLPFDSVY